MLLFNVLTGCKIKLPDKDRISIKGSDTMVHLSLRWAEEYMKINPGVSIQVTGGGSGTGIAALLNGTAHIANISRELKERELKKAGELNIEIKKFAVALDGIALISHPSNLIDTLTRSEIRDIYSGKITNWKQVGGADNRIVLYGRENSSGTYEFFKETILGKNEEGFQIDFSKFTQVLQGTAALAEAVAKDKNGIGYGGVGYFALRSDLKVIHIKLADSLKALSPIVDGVINYDIIRNGLYPLTRELYCYTNGEPKKSILDFMKFIKSSEGQRIVQKMEYIPLSQVD